MTNEIKEAQRFLSLAGTIEKYLSNSIPRLQPLDYTCLFADIGLCYITDIGRTYSELSDMFIVDNDNRTRRHAFKFTIIHAIFE